MSEHIKVKKLIMVEGENPKTGAQNNKFYNMVENSDNTFSVEYGRIGATSAFKTYGMNKWNSTLNSKLRKGYIDNTELFLEKEEKSNFKEIEESRISRIVAELQRFANASISENYIVGSGSVTQKQVARVQELINDLVEHVSSLESKREKPIEEINKTLLEVFRVIPRRMSDVRRHLLSDENQPKEDLIKRINSIIDNEQKTLDVMESQVKVSEVENDNQTILETMEIDIFDVNQEDISMIKKMLGRCSNQFVEAFMVINKKTQKKFDDYVEGSSNKKRKLFFHGSRNENWFSIINNGLVLRPSNAVITGKYFGYGIYGADRAKKSIGYTSLTGSYWARGRSNVGFMSLFNFHLGNMLQIDYSNDWMGRLTKERLKKRGDYDSVFAKKNNNFLYNNEYIVYDEAQCTIRFLVKLKG